MKNGTINSNNKCCKLLPFLLFILVLIVSSCSSKRPHGKTLSSISAEQFLGNPEYQAISYGGYRATSRDTQPSLVEIKEDMRILSALGIKLIRTYNVKRPHASTVLKAIHELKSEHKDFEMYVMLGAWIDCENAWTGKPPNHKKESKENAAEIDRAVALTKKYPDIVKIIAVGNEAMVKWATEYYVEASVILKWVKHLQNLKLTSELPKDIWITSSDNFASWGGGSEDYHVPELVELIKTVDYISMHTYPMHDTHYNPDFWLIKSNESASSEAEKIEAAMLRAKAYAQSQYESVANYVKNLGVEKPIHIGETGWASFSDGFYGQDGSRACDEYKAGIYHKHMRDWTYKEGISCFFFEAFDKPWKDANNPNGSENHFGLFTVDGNAKYAIWDQVDEEIFEGLSRGGNKINKTFDGDKDSLMKFVFIPPIENKIKGIEK